MDNLLQCFATRFKYDPYKFYEDILPLYIGKNGLLQRWTSSQNITSSQMN